MSTGELVLTILGSSTLFEGIKWLVGRFDEKQGYATREDLNTIKGGLMALCQNILEEKMQHYLNIGEITDNQFKALTTMYNAYAGLGGNDFVHELYEASEELYRECKKVDMARRQ